MASNDEPTVYELLKEIKNSLSEFKRDIYNKFDRLDEKFAARVELQNAIKERDDHFERVEKDISEINNNSKIAHKQIAKNISRKTLVQSISASIVTFIVTAAIMYFLNDIGVLK